MVIIITTTQRDLLRRIDEAIFNEDVVEMTELLRDISVELTGEDETVESFD